jgi:hypothetical protein
MDNYKGLTKWKREMVLHVHYVKGIGKVLCWGSIFTRRARDW